MADETAAVSSHLGAAMLDDGDYNAYDKATNESK
jgi:hypothetical protein